MWYRYQCILFRQWSLYFSNWKWSWPPQILTKEVLLPFDILNTSFHSRKWFVKYTFLFSGRRNRRFCRPWLEYTSHTFVLNALSGTLFLEWPKYQYKWHCNGALWNKHLIVFLELFRNVLINVKKTFSFLFSLLFFFFLFSFLNFVFFFFAKFIRHNLLATWL